ncbi:MAG: transporter substrate-binding domain-containing protein [Opitutae bacterium]|nr:transporter substrate-binding domain-containing protein [Opitutae bacterium]
MTLVRRLVWLTALLAGFCLVRADIAVAPPTSRVGMLDDNYPFSFRQADGTMAGFAVDLTREIEAVMGLRFERVTGRTREVHEQFKARQLDVLQAYARFPEREREVDFSIPYMTMAGALFVRAEEKRIASLEDCRGKRVAVHRGSLGETILRRAKLDQSIFTVDSVEEAVRAVARGEADATLVSRLSGLALAHHLGVKNLRVLEGDVPGYSVQYCYAVQSGDRELLARINEGLAILERTGRFGEIYRQWFGHLEPSGYSALAVMMAVAAGLVVALLVALWAVWRLRRMQARLVRKSEEIRAVFDGAYDGLLVLDRDGAENLRVRRINPAGVRLLGLRALPAPGAPLTPLLGAEAALAAKLAEAAAPNGVHSFEYEKADAAGWWRVTVGPLGRSVLVSLGDITEQVRARQQLRQQEQRLMQAQKLEAIGTLAGGIAHDFNNVLTAILGHTELSLLSLPTSRPEHDGLQQVMRAARRARQLVQQILAFSRRAESARQPVEIAPLLKETTEFLRVLGRGAVAFEMRLTGETPPIFADPAQAHQVFMNIGTNAVQALRGVGGHVIFLVDVLEVTAADSPKPVALAPGRYVRVGIQDDGPGMAPEVVARVFEPFFTTKAPGEGTGLGLSVVHGIVQQHGGAVTVYSQPGRGTLFNVYLPAAASDVPTKSKSPFELPRGRGQEVLVVDDDDVVLSTTREILAQLGYRPCAFERAEMALAEFEARPADFAAVFTDLTMPGMNGLQLTARIKTLRPTQPVLLASGFFTEAEEIEATKLRVARLVPKPFSLSIVAEAVAGCAVNRE